LRDHLDDDEDVVFILDLYLPQSSWHLVEKIALVISKSSVGATDTAVWRCSDSFRAEKR